MSDQMPNDGPIHGSAHRIWRTMLATGAAKWRQIRSDLPKGKEFKQKPRQDLVATSRQPRSPALFSRDATRATLP